MGEILLIRHGQASFGADNYDQLSANGWAQARALGEYFREREIRFDRVITGSMLRHRETLEGILLDGLELEPEIEPGLNEYDFHTLVQGYLQQFPAEQSLNLQDSRVFYRQLRITLAAWADGSLQTGLPESWADFEGRIQASLEMLRAQADAQRVLVVSSGGAISMLVRAVLGLAVAQMISMNLQMANTGITRMLFKGDKVLLQSWNAVPHLDHPKTQHLITFT